MKRLKLAILVLLALGFLSLGLRSVTDLLMPEFGHLRTSGAKLYTKQASNG